MRNGNLPPQGALPIIGAAKRILPIEPFFVAGVGWFNPTPEMTVVELAQILSMLVSLMLPRPQGVELDVKLHAETFGLLPFFTQEAPASMKKLEEEAKLLKSGGVPAENAPRQEPSDLDDLEKKLKEVGNDNSTPTKPN